MGGKNCKPSKGAVDDDDYHISYDIVPSMYVKRKLNSRTPTPPQVHPPPFVPPPYVQAPPPQTPVPPPQMPLPLPQQQPILQAPVLPAPPPYYRLRSRSLPSASRGDYAPTPLPTQPFVPTVVQTIIPQYSQMFPPTRVPTEMFIPPEDIIEETVITRAPHSHLHHKTKLRARSFGPPLRQHRANAYRANLPDIAPPNVHEMTMPLQHIKKGGSKKRFTKLLRGLNSDSFDRRMVNEATQTSRTMTDHSDVESTRRGRKSRSSGKQMPKAGPMSPLTIDTGARFEAPNLQEFSDVPLYTPNSKGANVRYDDFND